MAQSDAPAIETQELTKRYGRALALDGLTMRVPRGEVFGFLGPNGAGKTTAVKLLIGLARPTGGQARVLGSPAGALEARSEIGYLPELFRYQGWLTGREVLGLHLRLARRPRTGWGTAIDQVLGLVGLGSRGDDRVAGYSKGMQQRLGLAVALIGRPQLVLLDEPTSALDPVGRQDVREIIRSLRGSGTTIFLNSHLLTEVEQVCDRVVIVNHGRATAEGTLEELLRGDLVRIRATGLTAASRRELERVVPAEDDGAWLVFRGLEHERIPDVVAHVVRLGARVYAVESRGQTLEDRFRELVGETDRR